MFALITCMPVFCCVVIWMGGGGDGGGGGGGGRRGEILSVMFDLVLQECL